jgi:serpin B
MTHGKIPEVLERGALAPGDGVRTAFTLADAVFFGGKWAKPFLLDTTRLHSFTRSDGSEVAVPLMHARGQMEAMRGPGFLAVDVPYEGDEYSMTILLPDEPDGLPALEQALSPTNFEGWMERLWPADVTLFLPGFAITSDIDLNQPLREMGVTDAFEPGRADFSGAAGDQGQIYLRSVRQKAVITVTEEGTEAMAVTTAIFVQVFSMSNAETVIVDHPFLFAIRHRPTATLLFLGRVEDPSL